MNNPTLELEIISATIVPFKNIIIVKHLVNFGNEVFSTPNPSYSRPTFSFHRKTRKPTPLSPIVIAEINHQSALALRRKLLPLTFLKRKTRSMSSASNN